jgi:DNA topoisomerase-3
MIKTLVVAEKPSVADDYARALGGPFEKHEGYLESDRWIVSWAVGHLVGLAEPEEYDEALRRWSIKSLPILPDRFRLRPDPRGRKQLGVLETLMKRGDVDEVVNGCDAGREGELIFAYIYEWVGATKPVRRLWVSSMTRDAIREGFEHLRPGADVAHLADAARSRSEADWLVGMNATRAATVRARALGGVVSLGRVQTPTLALIVKRDAQIDAFDPETYFLVEATFALEGDARRYAGRWFFEKDERLSDRARADRVAGAAGGAPCRVASVKRTERRERAPLLYDLTSLQREANSRFGLTAARTLAAAQRLYEGSAAGALLTYPRTRTRFLPSDQAPQLSGIAARLAAYPQHRAAADYVAGLDALPLARVVDDARVDDHHAIIPTGELASKELTGDDARVYDLVVRRFLAVFHPDASWEDTEIVTEAGGEHFRTRGRRLVEAGWRAAYDDVPADAPDDGGTEGAEPEATDQRLPRVEEDERGRCEAAVAEERQTRPPARYSEASLLAAMESAGRSIEDDELREAMKDSGLGTPATRAETIEKLIRAGYLERTGRSLRASAKGRQAIGLLGDSALASAELTGRWERRLGLIESGRESRDSFVSDIRDFTDGLVAYFRGVTSADVRAQRAVIGPCPNGDGEIRENRMAYGCSSWKSKEEPGCGFVIWKTIKGRSISPREASDLLAQRQTQLLDGFRTRPSKGRLVLVEGQVQLVDEEGTRLDTPGAERESIATCPRCGGQIKENSRAYGCSSWKSKAEPGCGFVIWKSTGGHAVTPDEARELIEHGRTGEIDFKERKRAYRGRLVLTDDLTVAVETPDGVAPPAVAQRKPARESPDPAAESRSAAGDPAPARLAAAARPGATARRPAPDPAVPAASAESQPAAPRSAVGVLERPGQPPVDGDLLALLAAEGVEAIDRRAAGGALWVVGGPELGDLMARLAARDVKFVFAEGGGRATKHRPGWWTK